MASSYRDDCPYVLSEFLNYIETIKNLSSRTVEGYYIDLRTFLRFLKRERGRVNADVPFNEIKIADVNVEDIATVRTVDVYEYLHTVTREFENNPNTRARKVSSLRAFFKYLTVKSHILNIDPVKNIEVPSIKKSLPKFLTLEESLLLLEAPEGENEARDYCILTLFLNCGMRLSELVGINDSDIRGDQLRLVGKGNKERIIFLNQACLDAVARYQKARDEKHLVKKDPKALFLSVRGGRLTPRRVEQIVDENLKKSGLADRGYSAHKLRHTAATLMYRYGDVDMLALKEILGHEHVSTTEIYTHISSEQLKKASDANPLSKVKRGRPSKKTVEDEF